jgi:hypothetical protein
VSTRVLLWLGAVLVVIVGVGTVAYKRAQEPERYPVEIQRAALAVCHARALTNPQISSADEATEYCSCALERIEATVPYEDFARLDSGIQLTTGTSEEVQRLIADAAMGCYD